MASAGRKRDGEVIGDGTGRVTAAAAGSRPGAPPPPAARLRGMDRRTLGVAAVILVTAGLLVGLLFGAIGAGSLPGITGSASPTPPQPTVYTSRLFTPPTTVEVPPIWVVTADDAAVLTISPLIVEEGASPTPTEVAGIYLFRDALAASQDPACTSKPDGTVKTDAKSLADWVSVRPGLTATKPTAVTIGGLSGWQVDAQIAPTWTTACPFADGAPSVNLLVNKAGTPRWVVFGSEKLRLAFLDVPDGGTVTVNRSVNDKSIFDGFISETDPIIASMEFAAK